MAFTKLQEAIVIRTHGRFAADINAKLGAQMEQHFLSVPHQAKGKRLAEMRSVADLGSMATKKQNGVPAKTPAKAPASKSVPHAGNPKQTLSQSAANRARLVEILAGI
jgi:hypothetical protein